MYFKLLYSVSDFIINENEDLEFEITSPRKIIAQIKRPSKIDLEKGHLYSNAFCDVFTCHEPNEKIKKIFEKIEANEIILEGDEIRKVLQYKYKESQISLPALDDFPDYFVSYVTQINSDLSRIIKNLIGLTRWINNLSGPHNPLGHRGFYWSHDNVFWHPFPSSLTVFMDQKDTVHLSPKSKKVILDLVNMDKGEPIYHELFREAWMQRSRNPRSALIIGIASAEVGVKETISRLVPDAKWLLENLQSPPIYVLLKDYWPKLLVKNRINESSNFPDSILSLIKKGVSIRNKVIHLGINPPNSKEIEKILHGIKDLLFLLDFYSGFDFTYRFISESTINELTCKKN